MARGRATVGFIAGGSYRVIDRLDENRTEIIVVRIDHRSDVYQSR